MTGTSGTLHNFEFDEGLQVFVCRDCGMTAQEILNEDIRAELEHREPIYLISHMTVGV